MEPINHDHFEMARTPEHLKELLLFRDESFLIIDELAHMFMRFTNANRKAFVDQEFRGAVRNAQVYSQIKDQGYRAMEAGVELINLVEQWRDLFEIGDGAQIVQRSCFSRSDARTLIDNQMAVRKSECD